MTNNSSSLSFVSGTSERPLLYRTVDGVLKAAADALDKEVAKYADPKTPQEKADKRALEQARLRAQMDLGLNYIDQATTYVDESKNDVLIARSKVYVSAIE